jgi:benzoyl-CoA 2,3-dioxygenase component B
MTERDVPVRNAMNEILRDAYIDDNQRGVDRWNRMIKEAGVNYTITLPNRRFNRTMGIYAGHHFDPQGNPVSAEEFERRKHDWLPDAADRAWVQQLMQPVLERGKMANWIAAPDRGVKGQPVDFEYIRRV